MVSKVSSTRNGQNRSSNSNILKLPTWFLEGSIEDHMAKDDQIKTGMPTRVWSKLNKTIIIMLTMLEQLEMLTTVVTISLPHSSDGSNYYPSQCDTHSTCSEIVRSGNSNLGGSSSI